MAKCKGCGAEIIWIMSPCQLVDPDGFCDKGKAMVQE